MTMLNAVSSTWSNLLRSRWLAMVCVLSLFSVGCTPANPVGTVKGTATVKGKPYSDAAVMFISLESGSASGGDLQPDGTFKIPDPLPVGTYTVYFAPKSIPVEDATAAPVPMQMDKTVPSKYWNESESDIKIQVIEGENTVPIEIP
jgi:hypothetical protein